MSLQPKPNTLTKATLLAACRTQWRSIVLRADRKVKKKGMGEVGPVRKLIRNGNIDTFCGPESLILKPKITISFFTLIY